MANTEAFFRSPAAEEFFRKLQDEVLKLQRPADEIFLDEVQFIQFLNISKRLSASLRQEGIITYSKIGGKIYYKLSNILEMLDRYEVPAAPNFSSRKFNRR